MDSYLWMEIVIDMGTMIFLWLILDRLTDISTMMRMRGVDRDHR